MATVTAAKQQVNKDRGASGAAQRAQVQSPEPFALGFSPIPLALVYLPRAHAKLFQCGLIDSTNGRMSVEFTTEDDKQAAAWVDAWLDEPLDQIPFIVSPAGFERKVG